MRKLVALVLALCLVFGATCAMAIETQTIQVGPMNFQLPSALSGGLYANGNPGIEAHTYSCAKYNIDIASLNFEAAENDKCLSSVLSLDHLADEHSTALYWSLQLFAGVDAKTAATFLDNAKSIHWNGVELKILSTPRFVAMAFCHEGTGYFLGLSRTEGSSISQSQMETIGLEIASSYHLAELAE
mgnify:CR=1 FL=1